MALLWLGGGVAVVWIVAAILGVGNQTVFRNPESMSDAQLERTVKLTGADYG